MTHPAIGSDYHLLPATVAGLWTAITTTHEAVAGCHSQAATHSDALARIADHVREAAETLACAAGGPGPTNAAIDREAAIAQPTEVPDLAQMCTDCITLAVEVLGNEDQDLSPFDVLAVTRCVTALCAARTCAQELAA